jgi:hypothetical protein
MAHRVGEACAVYLEKLQLFNAMLQDFLDAG